MQFAVLIAYNLRGIAIEIRFAENHLPCSAMKLTQGSEWLIGVSWPYDFISETKSTNSPLMRMEVKSFTGSLPCM